MLLMTGLPTALAVALPLVGIVVGAILQYFFSHFTERRKELRKLRSEAYVDYLRSVSESPRLPAGDATALREFLVKLTEAKTRLCVYGSAKVIDALADIEAGGAKIATPEQVALFLRIVQVMREDSAADRRTPKVENLRTVLMGDQRR